MANNDKRTFNLPNYDGYLPIYDSSAALGANTNGKAPNITGTTSYRSYGATGAFMDGATRYTVRWWTDGTESCTAFDASRCSSVYDNNATKITPAGVNTLICIKF